MNDIRLMSFVTPHGPRIGHLGEGIVTDIQAAEFLRQRHVLGRAVEEAWGEATRQIPRQMHRLLAEGQRGIDKAMAAAEFGIASQDSPMITYPERMVEFLPVVNLPPKCYVARGNFRRHREEISAKRGTTVQERERPRFLPRARTSLIGHRAPIIYPSLSEQFEHEVELAIVIGTGGRRIEPADARRHIAGFTILLDMTARDLSGIDDRNKSFDGSGPLGPCLVPVAAVDDPHSLQMTLRVNGEVRQEGSTSAMEFGVDDVVSFMSQAIRLEPGDVIGMGTPEGVGTVAIGDTVAAEIAGIGLLECPVVAEKEGNQ